MPLQLSDFEHPPICHGYVWAVQDEENLAKLVGELILGQARHVRNVLQGLHSTPTGVDSREVEKAIDHLTLSDGQEPYLRDGWIFQFLSWIASQLCWGKQMIATMPHMGTARKGFDGVILEFASDDRAVERVFICEDKATENPRQTLREQVWPEIRSIEANERSSEIRVEVTNLLERKLGQGSDRVAALVEDALWKDRRAYRVSITADGRAASGERRELLFKGYDSCAPGSVRKRRAEVICEDALREWMNHFCSLVVDYLEDYAGGENV